MFYGGCITMARGGTFIQPYRVAAAVGGGGGCCCADWVEMHWKGGNWLQWRWGVEWSGWTYWRSCSSRLLSPHLPPLADPCFVACDGSDIFPDLPHVVLPQLLLHFLPVGVFCLIQAAFHHPLCCFHLLFVFIPEGLFLLVEDSLDCMCYSWFVIWIKTQQSWWGQPHLHRSWDSLWYSESSPWCPHHHVHSAAHPSPWCCSSLSGPPLLQGSTSWWSEWWQLAFGPGGCAGAVCKPGCGMTCPVGGRRWLCMLP